jgi:hypothetical protein
MPQGDEEGEGRDRGRLFITVKYVKDSMGSHVECMWAAESQAHRAAVRRPDGLYYNPKFLMDR